MILDEETLSQCHILIVFEIDFIDEHVKIKLIEKI